MPHLQSDIVGQVRRLPLRPSESNSLLPLHEAISNSLHAIQDRFGNDNVVAEGRIDIDVVRDGGADGNPVIGFRVTDNGIGLNDRNYKSFLTPFSQLKIQRGGKGVGRLGWLKVFEDIRVESRYQINSHVYERSFNFLLRDADQIDVVNEGESSSSKIGTTVYLEKFLDSYGTKCPVRTDTIIQRIIAHFLPIFAADSSPKIYLNDEGSVIELKEYFASKVNLSSEDLIEIEIDGESLPFLIRHMRCDKHIRPRGGQHNWVCFCADERGVKEYPIDEQIGLQSLNGEEIYVGTVTSDFLDSHVNPQRTDFIFESDDGRSIRRRVAASVKVFLQEFIDEALAQKKVMTRSIISKNPQYIYLNEKIDSFVESLKPNSNSEEQIYLEMSQDRYRRQRRFNGVGREIQKAVAYDEVIAEKVDEYNEYIVDDQRGALALYVTRRKAVLDLLDKLRGFSGPEHERHHLEESIHKLICPMRIDSNQLSIDDHNLWILDDRLAFFNYFASDKLVRQYTDAGSSDRPDLAFFYDSCVAWREGDRNSDTVVLVEFKRPGRNDYTPIDNPLRQILKYVQLLMTSNTINDAKGGIISGISDRTSFQCYVVADITDKLLENLVGMSLLRTPDNEGMFGYTDNPRAYLEIVPYSKLLADAQLRNSVFFEKLGLNG